MSAQSLEDRLARLRLAAPAALAPLVDLLARNRILRFLIVGGLNTAFGYGLFLVMLFIVESGVLAVIASTVIAILFNFVTTGSLVFGARDSHRLVGFFAVYGIVFIYNVAGMYALELMGMAPWLAGLALIPGGAALSYALNRFFVFGDVA